VSTDDRHGAAPHARRLPARCADAALGLLLFAATIAYLAALPLTLGTPDEAHDLLGVRRVLDGEVLYRDVFSFTTPGWTLLMTSAFSLFGATLATARLTVAVIHGLTAALSFLVCRQLGVGRALAVACAVAYVAVARPMFPIATYHWLTTFFCMLLLGLCLRAGRSLFWSFGLGLAVGLPIVVHQQRGLAMGLGVGAILVGRRLLDRHYGTATPAPALGRQLGAFAAGIALVVGTVLAGAVLTAGFAPVWHALVMVPLFNYRGHVTCRWGTDFTAGARSALSPLFAYAPLTLALTVVPLAVQLWRRRDPERARVLLVLSALSAAAMLSILYHPDTIRIGLILPLVFVVIADALERTTRALPAPLGRLVAASAALAVVVPATIALHHHRQAQWAVGAVPYESALGRIDLPRPAIAEHWKRIETVVAATPSRELYVHPAAAYMHLILGLKNPVRFPFTSPAFTSSDQIDEIIATLEAKQVRYALTTAYTWRSDDRLSRYVREHYQPSPELPVALWVRRERPIVEPPRPPPERRARPRRVPPA